MITNKNIDNGKSFDWGRTSSDYAKYRDIYPEEFYQRIIGMGLCTKGQRVLDLGTGTGVLPRNLYRFGAEFSGIDISENQIAYARKLAEEAGMDIAFACVSAEESDFAENTFDAVTACQCFTYFDHSVLAPRVYRILREKGRFAVLYMAWLPFEDDIAGRSEELILKYNPGWTGCREVRHKISIPDIYREYFTICAQEVFDLSVHFTRESWHGRMKACRGIGASLSDKEIESFAKEHRAMLAQYAQEEFEILHYAAVTVLEKKR